MASLGHPVVGDALYGAPREIRTESGKRRAAGAPATIVLARNFLHSTKLELAHPRTAERLSFERGLPDDLAEFVQKLNAAQVQVTP
jgi:23S rRNA pseudouridine1911/1915/1917 synthase